MFWVEDDKQDESQLQENAVDVVFTVSGKTLPVDHAHDLHETIVDELPWMQEEEDCGIHLIHVAESGNGWERPDGDFLYLSRRTKFTIRVPKQRVSDAQQLIGKVVNVAGHELEFTKSVVRPFNALPTMFSRYVLGHASESENDFLQRCASELKELGIPVRKMMAGKTHTFELPEGERLTRTLLVADLSPEHALLLQQKGLGEGRMKGFGLFIPHKGITAVTSEDGKAQSMD
ncbi:MAG: type I-MYXAN CRISPR-associated protein Cas6/Cmx6 [Chromatiales bacterium]|nr:type I-MYXAN CRISPR-associated protein Cas6/Cmx6 [Chromatiales bacterium]